MLASGSELFRLMDSGSCKTACSEGGTSVRSVCRNDRLQDAAYYSQLLGVAVVPRELTTPKLATVKTTRCAEAIINAAFLPCLRLQGLPIVRLTV